MKDFEELRALWKEQKAPQKSPEAMLQEVRQDNRYFTQKILVQSGSVALCMLILLSVGLFFHFHTWTSYIALFILSACLLYYVIIQIQEYRILRKPVALALTPSAFIGELTRYLQQNAHRNRKNYRIYLWGIASSLGLFLIELYFVLPLWIIVLFLIGTVLWLYVAWAYILKEYIHRRQVYFETMIQRLSDLQKQFDSKP